MESSPIDALTKGEDVVAFAGRARGRVGMWCHAKLHKIPCRALQSSPGPSCSAPQLSPTTLSHPCPPWTPLTVLVGLYEEPERPPNAVDYIKRYMGAPTGVDVESIKAENDSLKRETKELKEQIKDLNARLEEK